MDGSFSRVDASADPSALVRYLDEAGTLPLFQEADRQLLAELRLGAGSRVLDVGCGTGDDALAMVSAVAPGGRVTGVDSSAAMVAEARRRATLRAADVDFRVGSAEDLGYPDGHFDACRFERVLQHLADPLRALREAARVLRPSGRVAAFEPDWSSLEIGGGDPDVTRRILLTRLRMVPSADVGARLPRLLIEAGFEAVRARELTLAAADPAAAVRGLRLTAYAQAAVEAGAVTFEAAAAWLAAAARGRLRARGTMHLVSGTRSDVT